MKAQERLLSLCMIVKNEEATIARCLKSARAAVDEMIVVDTGSTDRTPQMCAAAGAKVLHFPWQNNFAEARNHGLKEASGRWVLWLDADETLQVEDCARLRDALRTSEETVMLVELINYYGAQPPDPYRAHKLLHHRLLRNGLGLRFKGRIHEQLDFGEVMPGDIRVGEAEVRVHHFGYMDEAVTGKQKHLRNMALLRGEKERRNDDPWIDFHLAGELYRVGDYRSAFEQVNAAMRGFLSLGQIPPSLLYKLKYASLLESGSWRSVWPAIERAIELYPDYVDLHFYCGIVQLARGDSAAALAAFETCLRLGEGYSVHLTTAGAGSFLAEYYIGLCHEHSGESDAARRAYIRALDGYPQLEEALARLESGERSSTDGGGAGCRKPIFRT
ncbi:glycosyltransferase [Paenibacillus sp. IB182496]|uniref:Glycosyltransferase n=1 Tax=Paenibacillus sabuli TaxID=2772509 RepID=A0A927BY99_9BACL|nr:glycosyltransferase [Paenibacillus sabuli]MBD2847629.1 glycosyltransferase [Paenibacillus sabuli]